jgi:hypothetical protein
MSDLFEIVINCEHISKLELLLHLLFLTENVNISLLGGIVIYNLLDINEANFYLFLNNDFES